MNDRFTNIDDKIREALRKEDAELLEHYRGEAPLHEMIIETFRGRRVWMTFLALVYMFVFFGLALFALYGFFHAEGTRTLIAWACGFLWSSLAVAMLKIWFWMEIQRNSVVREIKRLELQIANLSRQLNTKA
jgi:hypothetical protein